MSHYDFTEERERAMNTKIWMLLIGTLITFTFVMMSCFNVPLSWYPDDNNVEEFVEDAIMLKTGVDVDFTGSTPE